MRTLKLFNAVLSKEAKGKEEPFISEDGFIIEPNALWAKDRILGYYEQEKLNGNDLNKTFHKSWAKIKNSTRLELLIEQIRHYLSTYGSNFQNEIYIPEEVLKVPKIKVIFKVIKAYTAEELKTKCLNMLKSGIALKEETVDDLISILVDELDYSFTGKEGIRNKEAIVKIAENYGVYPDNPVEFLRYIIYRSTGQTLLIKNPAMYELIKKSSYNPTQAFKSFGLVRIAEIFNRFKPIFLSYKEKSPKTINKISKLSKQYHKPLVENPLNRVTSIALKTIDKHWLDNATPYALFKALSALHNRRNGQEAFLYRIRNGKSWVKETEDSFEVVDFNYGFLMSYLQKRYDFTGKKFYLPEDIKFALPTSEKMFVGDIPTGTRFYGERLAVGIYWENGWGARDLDLSGVTIDGDKVGWNSRYNLGDGKLLYSGDITNAPEGAVEYLHAKNGLDTSVLITCNVFSGKEDSGYKIIIGRGNVASKEYMFNPNNLFAEVKTNAVQKQNVLGVIIPKKNRQCFVVLNFGAGHARVSGHNKHTSLAIQALYEQWKKPLSFNKLIKELGAEITETNEEVDFDFSLQSLTRDSFMKVFE